MIESISLLGIASYGTTPETMSDLSDFNYVFGTNGCGKTTISRVIADESAYGGCRVKWKGNAPLQTMVYNRDFVEMHFTQSEELKGVFTLGEQNVDTIKKIAGLKEDVDKLAAKLERLTQTLGGPDGTNGKIGELDVHETVIRDQCWAQKQKHDKALQGAFTGFRDKKDAFKGKVLLERLNTKGTSCTLADLHKRAETVFGKTPSLETSITALPGTSLVAHESAPILKKKVIGKSDVDIAAMIAALGNSDWVREGRAYLDVNDRRCPFCQQTITASFEKSLSSYFDATFEADSKSIDTICSDYKADALRVQQQASEMIANPSRYLDIDKFILEKQVLDSTITVNVQRLEGKRREPSTTVTLDSLTTVLSAMSALVADANKQISAHNSTVNNLVQERTQLTHDVWKFVVTELDSELTAYDKNRDAAQKGIDAIRAQIASTNKEKSDKEVEIRELEKSTTSVQPTIDGINLLLKSFGFEGFTLAKAASGTSYKLVRGDGTDAKVTLSEGEKTFVTFLYFYHLLKGSDSQSGMTRDRVVVFDDPVSSLDSDILFIVGSLIKGLFDEVRQKKGHIKQVFVLTHNVYFHKEVTFNPDRRSDAMREETFWIVRKSESLSRIEKHTSNPIKTSYELLWSEVRSSSRSRLTIQNTLRRILENYFKILGGINSDKICDMFDGKERLICKSLFSWVNDGSHYAHDDVYVSIDETMVESYLLVFKNIFEKTKHMAHFNMMMGIEC